MQREIIFKEKVMDFVKELIDDDHTDKSPAMVEAIAELVKSINLK